MGALESRFGRRPLVGGLRDVANRGSVQSGNQIVILSVLVKRDTYIRCSNIAMHPV